MHELTRLYHLLLDGFRSAWRFRWQGAAVSWGICLAGWAFVAMQDNVYQANALVYVDTSSVLEPFLGNQIIAPDVLTELTYVHQALLGREHLQRVVRENNLDAEASTDVEREDVLESLREAITLNTNTIDRQPGNYLSTISYRSREREQAMTVVGSLLDSLVEGTLGGAAEGAETTEKFLGEQIAVYDRRLREAEERLAEFKKANAEKLPGAEGGYYARMQELRSGLGIVQRALRQAESKREQLLMQLNSESPVMAADLAADFEPPPNSLDGRIRAYRAQLDSLLLDFTERHPDVIAVREALRQLESQRASQLTAVGVRNPDQELTTLNSSPVYQQLQIALNETEVEIASLRAEVVDRTAMIAELQDLVDEVPEVEAELARLNRDYEVVYAQFQRLIQSRETQGLSVKASDTDQIEFRVINPPFAPYGPVAPNRLLLFSGIFFVGIVSGGAFAWFLSLYRPVFTSVASLRESVGVPVIGVVTRTKTSREKLRGRLAAAGFVTVMFCLCVLFLLSELVILSGYFGPEV